jgi:hypothetical protein
LLCASGNSGFSLMAWAKAAWASWSWPSQGQGDAPRIVGLGCLWPQNDHLVEVMGRLLAPAEGLVGRRQVVVDTGLVGTEGQGPPQALDRLLVPRATQRQHAQLLPGIRVVGALLGHSAKVFFGHPWRRGLGAGNNAILRVRGGGW